MTLYEEFKIGSRTFGGWRSDRGGKPVDAGAGRRTDHAVVSARRQSGTAAHPAKGSRRAVQRGASDESADPRRAGRRQRRQTNPHGRGLRQRPRYRHDARPQHHAGAGAIGPSAAARRLHQEIQSRQTHPRPVLKTGEYKGHNYALPRTFETMVLYYNKTCSTRTAGRRPRRWPS
jgi:hypothetical protein